MIKSIEEVLKQISEYQGQLSEFYKNLNLNSQKQRIQMLLDYISNVYKNRGDNLYRFIGDMPEIILKTDSPFQPSLDSLTDCPEIKFSGKDEWNIDDVIEIALKYNQCIIDFYEQAFKSAETYTIREIFRNLMEMEKRGQRELVRDSQELKDL